MDLRAAIANDFATIVDSLEDVTIDGRLLHNVKRGSTDDEQEAVEALGLYISNFTTWRFPTSELAGIDPEFASVIVPQDGSNDEYLITGITRYVMTFTTVLRTVQTRVVAPDYADIYELTGVKDSIGALPGKFTPWKLGVPVRVIATDQSPSQDDANRLRPSYVAYLRTRGFALLPEGARLKVSDSWYDVVRVGNIERLGGFAALSLVPSRLGNIV